MAVTNTLLRSSDELPSLIAALETSADLSALVNYQRCRERGLRGQMAQPLLTFAEQAAGWSFADRQALVHWIGEPWIAAAGYVSTSAFAKRGDPVFGTVVAPTLREWRAQSPDAGEPLLLACLWDESDVGEGLRLDCLRSVIARHPDLLPARRAFVRAAVDLVDFAQHEWPRGYLGDPDANQTLLQEAETALRPAPDDDWRKQMEATLGEMRTLAQSAAERGTS